MIDFETQRALRIFRNAHQRIYNLIRLNRWDMAEETSRKLTAIFEMWRKEKINQ